MTHFYLISVLDSLTVTCLCDSEAAASVTTHKFCNDRWPEEPNDTPPHSPVQPTDENEETAAQPEGSSLIDPNAEDIELPEEEAESNSEDGDDNSDEEGSDHEADEADSDDLEYPDY